MVEHLLIATIKAGKSASAVELVQFYYRTHPGKVGGDDSVEDEEGDGEGKVVDGAGLMKVRGSRVWMC